MRGTTRDMSDAHEDYLVGLLGGRRTKGSGNQSNNPMDGRHSRYEEPLAFAWDGKSTNGNSIGVTRKMWAKAVEQAHGERPMLALRWYLDERLTKSVDLIAVTADDFAELLELAREGAAAREQNKASDRWLA